MEGIKQKWFERLFEYDEEKAKVEQLGRGIYKWFLEFIRNCMMVAALAYVAQKSGNWLMFGVAGRLRMIVGTLIGVVILQSIQAIITVGLFATIYKIVQTQAH